MIARLLGWLMDRIGLTLGDDQDISPPCANLTPAGEVCGHRYDQHVEQTDESDPAHFVRVCLVSGCGCSKYIPKL